MNSKKSLITRVFALVMVLVLAGGFVPSTVWASKLDYKSATLQIAIDTDSDGKNDLVVNKTYRFAGEKTLDDLFAAAKAAGDIMDYAFTGDYLSSVVVTNGIGGENKADYSLYWASYANGSYDSAGTYVKKSSALADGETVSFGYEGYPSGPTEVDWESVKNTSTVSDYFIGELKEGTTLQIAYDKDGDGQIEASEVVVNKVYGFEDGATLGDLFYIAKVSGDIKDYAFEDTGEGYYYLASVTLNDGTVLNNGPSKSKYWATYKNGESVSGDDAKKGAALKDGVSFQFEYLALDKSVKEVDWTQVDAPEISDAFASEGNDPTPEPDDDSDDKATVNKYDAEKAALLLENLAARFKKDCADASVSNTTFNAAVALNQLGMGANLDADAILENFEHDEAKSAGAYAKYILALTAAGVDCTNVTLPDGVSHNIVSDMEKTLNVDGLDIWSAVCILPVYQNYTDNSGLEAKLVEKILSCAGESGLFGVGKYYDTQTTAQAIVALLPYRNSNSDVKDAIEKAVTAIYERQNEDGGFAYSNKGDASNLDATSAAIVALTSLGYDCAEGKDLTTSNGSTPLGWLVAQADQDSLDAFDGAVAKEQTSVEVLTASDALLGLTADAQFNANGSFAAYKLKTVTRNSEDQSKKADDTTNTTNTTTKTTTKKGVPSTGDESVGAGVVLAVAATGAVVVLEAKRRRNAA